ncbi:DUF427 domain-containing protein [Tropicimonas sp. S265A]|uniref:DUF427 domain-containing protein n=1 Tax=Tropicimonas sp. S265A TaxID=3415134 RepID=UPI003C79E252
MTLPLEDVQDYPRPPALEPVPTRLRVILAGAVLAETTSGYRVLETHHPPTYYFPPEDVQQGALTRTTGSSWCEWKGAARYFDAKVGGMVSHRAAWAYPQPTKRFAPIAGFFSFYPERVEACFVGEELVENQPGSFYGGWVTSNLTGVIKGGPGTEGW